MTRETRLTAYSDLTQTITAAIVAALAAGMTVEDVAAGVTRTVELLEQED